ncbi:MAG: hypothetical protein P8Y17_02830, partial [Patescibacteria group bacterium]
ESTLRKFEVSYLVLDESIINPGGNKETLYLDEIKELISSSKHIEVVQYSGFLDIYKTDWASKDTVWTSEYTLIDADLVYNTTDPVYEEFGTYVYDENGLTIPFANYDFREKPEVIFDEDSLKILSKPLKFNNKKQLVIPVALDETSIKLNKNKQIEITLPIGEKENGFISRGLSNAKNCDLKEMGEAHKEIVEGKVFYRAVGGAASCDFYNYPELSLSEAFLLRIKGENLHGRSLKVYLQNWSNDKIDFETLLPEGRFDEYFFILPKGIDGFGYTLNLETRSYGRVSSENVLEKIEIIPIPIDTLRETKVVPEYTINIYSDIDILEANKAGTGYYSLKTNSEAGLIVLGQGYEKGWLGFAFEGDLNFFEKTFPWFFKNDLKHVKVNSWANGWYVPEGSQRIILIFWPQYLEYFGFALLFFGLLWALRGKFNLLVDKKGSSRLK